MYCATEVSRKMEYEAAVKAPLRLKGTANKDIQK